MILSNCTTKNAEHAPLLCRAAVGVPATAKTAADAAHIEGGRNYEANENTFCIAAGHLHGARHDPGS